MEEEVFSIHSSSLIQLRVLHVLLPILNVLRSKDLIRDYQQILRVLFLCRLGEIEATGDDRPPDL